MSRTLCLLISLVFVLGGIAQGAADPDLVGWWWFDEGAGTTASDSSMYGNHGELIGNPQWVAGYFRTALKLNGTDDYVEVPHDDTLTVDSEVTVAIWIHAERHAGPSNAGWQGILAKGNSQRSYSLYTTSGGVLHFSTAGVGTTSTKQVPLNEWVHIGAVVVGGGHEYYMNGEAAGTGGSGINLPGTADTAPVRIGHTQEGNRQFLGMLDDARVYRRALTQEEIQEVMTGSDLQTTVASNPVPEDAATDVPRDDDLSWTAGESAATHDVYLGTNLDDVNNASRTNPMGLLVSEGQVATDYDPEGLLEIGQTYYWRIDEVNAAPDNTIFKGSVWSFTAEPLAYPIADVNATSNGISEEGVGPENTINGSGLSAGDQHSTASSDMWLAKPDGANPIQIQYEFDGVYKLHQMRVWNYNSQFEPMLGFGLKDVTVEYSENGEDWTVLGDVTFNQATATSTYTANTTVEFNGVAAQFVRITVNSGYGPLGQFGLSEVRFMYIPAQAREPQPADGAANVSVETTLTWRTGRDAVSHEVYLATDPEALALVDTVETSSYTPDALDLGTTYYWQITEVQELESWEGSVWSFATQSYVVVDGFESYNDEDDLIYETWLDGWVNETGSTVGYLEAPFAERTIVHSGSQSMPLQYDNGIAPFYSEAEKDLGGMDLDTNGADTLRLFVAGQAPAFFESADGTIVMNAIGNDIWDAADQFRYVYKSLTGNGSVTARVDALDGSSDPWAKGGVMIRQDAEVGAINAFMALTGGNGGGATFQQRVTVDDVSVSQHTYDDGPLTPPYWVRVTREGNEFKGFTSPDGETWTQRGDAFTLDMAEPVLVGLAVTSHNINQATGAAFSNVSFTGNVTGNWQNGEIGAAQPTTGNAIEPLYVALEDTAGKVAVVTHPNSAAAGISAWQEWLIPYSELSGINLNSVKTMTIGVGDRNNPTSGGTGTIFIDDIGYGRPTE